MPDRLNGSAPALWRLPAHLDRSPPARRR